MKNHDRKGGKQSPLQKFFSGWILSAIFWITKPTTIWAASRFFDREESSIYNGSRSQEAVADTIHQIIEALSKTKDVVAMLIAPFIVVLTDGIYVYLGAQGISLDSIVYGRVFGASFMTNDVALFTYDLTTNNVYGIISMILFGIFSAYAAMAAMAQLITALTKYLYKDGSPQNREDLKETVLKFFLLAAGLAMIPGIIDLCLYIRDLLLYEIGNSGGTMVTTILNDIKGPSLTEELTGSPFQHFFAADSSGSLINQLRACARDSIINAIMYLASVALTIYFAFTYTGAALTMVILVGFLPIALVYDMKERGFLHTWIKAMLGILALPIIDASLLLIPILIGSFGSLTPAGTENSYLLVQFIACCCIIPARGFVRTLLGWQGSRQMENAGLGAVAAGLMAARSLARTAKSEKQRAKDKEEEKNESIDADYESANASHAKAEALNEENSKLQEQGMDTVNQFGQDFATELDPEAMNDLSMKDQVQARNDNLASGIQGLDEYSAKLDERIGAFQTQDNALAEKIDQEDHAISQLRAEKSTIGPKSPEHQRIDEEIGQHTATRQELQSERRKNLANLNATKTEKDHVRQAKQQATQILGQMQKTGTQIGATPEAARLDRLANIDNFEMPAYRNISPERRAELYEKRAAATAQEVNPKKVPKSYQYTMPETPKTGLPQNPSPHAVIQDTAVPQLKPSQLVSAMEVPETPSEGYYQASSTDPWDLRYKDAYDAAVSNYSARPYYQDAVLAQLNSAGVNARKQLNPEVIKNVMQNENMTYEEARNDIIESVLNENTKSMTDALADLTLNRNLIPDAVKNMDGFSEEGFRTFMNLSLEKQSRSQIHRYLQKHHII